MTIIKLPGNIALKMATENAMLKSFKIFFYIKRQLVRGLNRYSICSNPNDLSLILGYHVKVKVENPLYEDVLHTHAVVGMSPTQSNNT